MAEVTIAISSRTRAFMNREEARLNGMSTSEQAIRLRAFNLQRQYGNISGNQPYVPENERRNNTRIRNVVNRMLGR